MKFQDLEHLMVMDTPCPVKHYYAHQYNAYKDIKKVLFKDEIKELLDIKVQKWFEDQVEKDFGKNIFL